MQVESTRESGRPRAAVDGPEEGDLSTAEMLARAYDALRTLAAYHMARTGGEWTLPPTAVVHEAYMRMESQDRDQWSSRSQFLAVASVMIRRILVDHARRRGTGCRVRSAAARECEVISPDLMALDEALTRLGELSQRQARVVEMRYFGGLSVDQTAEVLGLCRGTINSDWRMARAWLRKELRS